MQSSFSAYLALGSNLNNPIAQLEKALIIFQKSNQIDLIQFSSIYQSPPFDLSDQPDYFNLVCEIKTILNPTDLLNFIKNIEKQMGRVGAARWSARIIDIDILIYNNSVFETSELTIPHKQLIKRNFFLEPLIEITSQEVEFIPFGKLKNYLKKIKAGIKKIKTVEKIHHSIASCL